MKNDYTSIGQRLLKLPGVRLKFDAQRDLHTSYLQTYEDGLRRDDTHFVSCDLHDPAAETFTHFLTCPEDLSEDDEIDLSYYNSCSWGEETSTLGAQIRLVRERFPDQDVQLP